LWKAKHNIKYSSEFENSYRERIFLEKKAIIEAHNSNPLRTYNRGFNKFSAMTKDEFRQTFLTLQTNTPFIPSSNTEV